MSVIVDAYFSINKIQSKEKERIIILECRVQNGSSDGTRFYGPVPLKRPVSTGPYILGRPVIF